MTRNESADVVVVGGGAAGAALATVLARAGVDVVLLERDPVHRDKVRGESIVPWGVAEVQRVGLTDDLLAAGGHWAGTWIAYDEAIDAAVSERHALDLGGLITGIPGSLNLPHADLCAALFAAARRAGARAEMGVHGIDVVAGPNPQVEVRDGDTVTRHIRTRLVVAADGRTSALRRRLGVTLHESEPPHLLSGLRVRGLGPIRADAEVQAIEDDVYFLGMPQRDGCARLYIALRHGHGYRLTGPNAAAEFQRAAWQKCIPDAEHWGVAQPAGPVATFPASDAWTDSPVREGVVFVGDAAGYANPLIGQGLAMTFRDVRIVSEALLEQRDWSTAALGGYVEERRERLERIRAVGRMFARIYVPSGPSAGEFRKRAAELMERDPRMYLPILAMYNGPESIPSVRFVDRFTAKLETLEETAREA